MQEETAATILKFYSKMESRPTLAGGDQEAGTGRSHPPKPALLRTTSSRHC